MKHTDEIYSDAQGVIYLGCGCGWLYALGHHTSRVEIATAWQVHLAGDRL